jgi:hypothetical protein
MITSRSDGFATSDGEKQISDDLDALLKLAEDVTSRLDDIDERRYKIRTRMFSNAVVLCIGFVIIVGLGAAADTLGNLNSTLRIFLTLGIFITALGFVGTVLIALITTRREQNKLVLDWRREYRLQQHLFSFIDQHMSRLANAELPSVRFSIAHMRLQRLYRPDTAPPSNRWDDPREGPPSVPKRRL